MVWSCPFCSYSNDELLPYCEQCNKQRQTTTEWKDDGKTKNLNQYTNYYGNDSKERKGDSKVAFTDEEIQAQEDQIKAEIAAKQPLVGKKEALDILEAEYSKNQKALKKIQDAKTKHASLRRVRGDGSCFYRAYLFSIFERFVLYGGSNAAVRNQIIELSHTIKNSYNQLLKVGYGDISVDMFHEAFMEQMEWIRKVNHIEVDLNQSVSFSEEKRDEKKEEKKKEEKKEEKKKEEKREEKKEQEKKEEKKSEDTMREKASSSNPTTVSSSSFPVTAPTTQLSTLKTTSESLPSSVASSSSSSSASSSSSSSTSSSGSIIKSKDEKEQKDEKEEKKANTSALEDELLVRFSDGGCSDYLVQYARFLTSGELLSNPQKYAPYLPQGKNITSFVQSEVDPVNKESDYVQCFACASAMGIGVSIGYLDQSDTPTLVTHALPSNLAPQVSLLYRPGHYDILYLK